MEDKGTSPPEVVPQNDIQVEPEASIPQEEPQPDVEEKPDPKAYYVYADVRAVKVLRMALNWFTNALIFVTVFICLVYSCRPNLTAFQLHIILCTVGYQFFMCQGVLALSRYNSWTVHLKQQHKIHVYGVFQLFGVAAVIAGSVLIILEMKTHFDSLHGILGLVALLTSAISFVVGITVACVSKCSANHKATQYIRIFHHVTEMSTLLLSAASLCLAFENQPFKLWLSLWFNNDVIPGHVLQLMTALFTFLVSVDFLIPVRKVVKYQ